MPDGLDALARRARHDLASLNHPPANWPVPRVDIDGRPMLDVLVVGGGQLGQTAAFALIRAGIRNLRVVDQARRGQEGPWATTARMPTLRSPKHLTGPDLGVPSLTFRAWYEAQHGPNGWESLYKIGRATWVDYLLWVRDTAGIVVENGIGLSRLAPERDAFSVVLERADGHTEAVLARHLVFALGRDGYGGVRLPAFRSYPAGERIGHVWHTGEPIDVTPLRGGRVAVLGANASAFDAAGTALEAGAAVTLWCRRPHLPQVNFTRGMTPGYLHAFSQLDDATRWAVSARLADEAAPPPNESVLRCTANPGFAIRFDEGWRDLAAVDRGVTITAAQGPERFDAAILGTGYALDLRRQPALAAVADQAVLWRERVPAETAARYPELAQYPYLDRGFGLVTHRADAQALHRVHLLGLPAAVSHGTLAADIPGLAPCSLRLAGALSDDLFAADGPGLADRLFAFEEPELTPTPYFVPLGDRIRRRS